MSSERQPAQTVHPFLTVVVRTLALVGALVWLAVVAEFFLSLGGRSRAGGGAEAWRHLLMLLRTTPVFLVFGVPALTFSFLGGSVGTRIAMGFLIAGFGIVGAVEAAPYVAPLLHH